MSITIAIGTMDANATVMGGETSWLSPLASRRLPPAIDQGQAYYWSRAWQTAQQSSLAELAASKGLTFDTAEDAIRWLLSEDDSQP